MDATGIKDLLYEIKCNNRTELVQELVENNLIQRHFKKIYKNCKSHRHTFRDEIGIIETLFKEIVLKNYIYQDYATVPRFLAYTYISVRGALIRELKKESPYEEIPCAEPKAIHGMEGGLEDTTSELAINRVELENAMNKLTKWQRTIIKMYYVEGYNDFEIGEKYKKVRSAVTRTRHRALESLKNNLE